MDDVLDRVNAEHGTETVRLDELRGLGIFWTDELLEACDRIEVAGTNFQSHRWSSRQVRHNGTLLAPAALVDRVELLHVVVA